MGQESPKRPRTRLEVLPGVHGRLVAPSAAGNELVEAYRALVVALRDRWRLCPAEPGAMAALLDEILDELWGYDASTGFGLCDQAWPR